MGFSSLEVSETMLDVPLSRLTFTFRPVFLIFCDTGASIMQKKRHRVMARTSAQTFSAHLPFTGTHPLLSLAAQGVKGVIINQNVIY